MPSSGLSEYPMADVNIYVAAVGGFQLEGGVGYNWTGPYMVALNLFKALSRHSQIDFRFHSIDTSCIKDPRIVPCTSIEPAKIIHVMQRVDLAETAFKLATHCNIVVGPNVVGTFYGHPETMPPGSTDPLLHQRAVCHGPHKMFLLPGLTPEVEALGQSFGKKMRAFPSGVDTEQFKPSDQARQFDILILNKGGYSTPDIYNKSLELGIKLHATLSKQYKVMVVDTYDFETWPSLLHKAKIIVNTTPHETQGLAIMEAQAAGVPVIHRKELPFQPKELQACQVDYSPEGFLEAIPEVLADYQKIGRTSTEFVRHSFSLQHMATCYENLLSEVA